LYIFAFWMLIRTWQSARFNVQPAALGQRTAIPSTKPRCWVSVLDASLLADARLSQIVVLGLGGGLLAHLLWGLTDAMALGARPAFVFWIILGLINGLHQQAQELGWSKYQWLNNRSEERIEQMIDWYSVGFDALWIFGLSLVVATLSFANYLARQEKWRFRQALEMPACRMMIDVGLVFFCLGWTGSIPVTWERIVWAVLALLFGVRTWQNRKLSKR
jgi:hypothetical protein